MTAACADEAESKLAATLAQAREQRDASLAEAQKWSEAHGRLCGQRDAALAELEKRTTERDVRETARQMAVRERDAAIRERDMALARETDLQNEYAKLSELHDEDVQRLTAERDAAEDARDRWWRAHDEIKAELETVYQERDAALSNKNLCPCGCGVNLNGVYQKALGGAKMSADKDIEAVLRQFDGAPSSANAKAAARLILEARRDREEMRQKLKTLTMERDAAVDCYDHIKAERDATLAHAQALEDRVNRLKCQLECNWCEGAAQKDGEPCDICDGGKALGAALERVREQTERAERFKAQKHWWDEEHAERLLTATDRIAQLEERVRELESEAKLTEQDVYTMADEIIAKGKRIAQLESGLDNEVRRRDEFTREAAELEAVVREHQAVREKYGPSELTTAIDARLPPDEMLRTLTLVRRLLGEYVADCGKYLDRIATLEADLAAAGQRAELEIAARLKAEAEGAVNRRLREAWAAHAVTTSERVACSPAARHEFYVAARAALAEGSEGGK